MSDRTDRVVVGFMGIRGDWRALLDALKKLHADRVFIVTATEPPDSIHGDLADLGVGVFGPTCLDTWKVWLTELDPRLVLVSCGRAEVMTAVVRVVLPALARRCMVCLVAGAEV